MASAEGEDVQAFTVVSGGQTGVDRGALDAALAAGVPIRGWCPRGRRAEDGRIPDRFPLMETVTDDYAERTRLNVHDSDATLILGPSETSPGTSLTARESARLGRPLLQVNTSTAPSVVADWIRAHGVTILNVAGPRESEVPGIYGEARSFVAGVLRHLGAG